MRRGDARFTYVAVAASVVTGAAYGYCEYFGDGEDEFGPVPNPWLPTWHWLHVVVVPLFVFAFGMIWRHHVVAKLRSGAPARRATGVFLVITALAMVASGYALQVAVDGAWRHAWAWAHGVTSAAFAAGFVVHLLVPVTRDRA